VTIELQVSFAEYRLFYRALLQKRPLVVEESDKRDNDYGVATIRRLLRITGLFCRI